MVLQDLRTRYAQYLESPQFSDLIAECKEILVSMMKILESKAVEVIENSESESEVVAELVPLQEEISSLSTEV